MKAEGLACLPPSSFAIKPPQHGFLMSPLSPTNSSVESPQEKAIATKIFVAQYDSLGAVREFVGQAAEVCGFDAKNIYAVELATDEAFTNIVEHAYGGESHERVECTCKITTVGLIVILHDCGQAFDPTAVAEPDLTAPLEERETGGLGIYLMRKLMDEVHFAPASETKDGCNTLTMIKRKEKAA
jgi:serine/threonine-protein kinase RsbW